MMDSNNSLRCLRAVNALLGAFVSSVLSGCWTPPVADVQPKGDARLIQHAIPVEVVKDEATVQSVDPEQQVVVLNFTDGTSATVKPGPRVTNFSKIRNGDKVKATVAQELSVYVLIDGMLPGIDGKHQPIKTDAKVLQIDPAYRLLTLQYPNRHIEVLKVGLDARLADMEAGDSVAIATTELRALKVRKR
jgi:hypothetical protein